jgi:hypothetical protein
MLNIFILLSALFDSFTIFQPKPESADILSTILIDDSSVTLWQTVNEPAFIDISISAIDSVLILHNSPETMEILRGDKYLAFIDEIVMFLNTDEFKLETVWLVNLRRPFSILDVIVLGWRVMVVNPVVPIRKES